MFGKLVLFLALAVAVSAKTADIEFLNKQKRVFELLLFIKQDSLREAEFYDVGRNYDLESNIDMYKNQEYVQEFLQWYKSGMLSKSAIYTAFDESHLAEMKMLFRILYYAKDFQTFYKTACWARLNMNDAVFTSAFTVAVFQREDCKYIRLPAIYEIYPNLFFDNTVIQDAHKIKMMRGLSTATGGMSNVETYMIYSNYTGDYISFEEYPEMKLSYYTEDPALNAFYYYYKQVFPSWLKSKDFNIPSEVRGSFYFYIHKQLMARYYLERISNGLPKTEYFDWFQLQHQFLPYDKFQGFYSNLVFQNGMVMPQRNIGGYSYNKFKFLKEINLLEQRLLDAIDSGFVTDYQGKMVNIYTEEGLNILGNMIEGNVDSCNRQFYGMYDRLARDILGMRLGYEDRNSVIPGALQYYSTSMRDPAFYRIYNKIMTYFFRYKKYSPYYKQAELQFPGIKIESVNVDKLITFVDQCDTLINSAVYVENFKEGMQMRIKARRECLNYKPFTYRFNINSDKETKAVMRIFLGPSSDEFEVTDSVENVQYQMEFLTENYPYFVELDQFKVTLRPGQNTIERLSQDSEMTMREMTPADEFYKKLQKALTGSEPFKYYEKYIGFPERLYLPKGSFNGMKFKFFFVLTQLDESKVMEYELPGFGKTFFDGKPLGFPLDRPMYPWKFYQDNMFFKDVFIYHKDQKINY